MDAFERRERIVDLIRSGVSKPEEIFDKLREDVEDMNEQQFQKDLVALQFANRIYWNAYSGYHVRGIAT